MTVLIREIEELKNIAYREWTWGEIKTHFGWSLDLSCQNEASEIVKYYPHYYNYNIYSGDWESQLGACDWDKTEGVYRDIDTINAKTISEISAELDEIILSFFPAETSYDALCTEMWVFYRLLCETPLSMTI